MKLTREILSLDSTDVVSVTPLLLATMKVDADLVLLRFHRKRGYQRSGQGRAAMPFNYAISYGTDDGYNERYIRPKSKKADWAASVIGMLLALQPAEAGVEKTAAETGAGEVEPSKWNKVGEEVKEAAHAVGEATVDTSKKVWGATKEESVGVWDKTKSKSKEIWEKGKAKVHDASAPEAADEDAAAAVDAASDTAVEEAQPSESH